MLLRRASILKRLPLGLCLMMSAFPALMAAESPGATSVPDDRYTPIPGGWQIRLRSDASYKDIRERNGTRNCEGRTVTTIDPKSGRLTPHAPIGLLLDNPRLHWRPLFPPAEKSLIWTDDEQARSPRVCFRPLVLAGTVPRFLFDYHCAGGLMGHLRIGLTAPGGGKWLQDWSDITVRYIDGRLEYDLRDEAFPGTSVRLDASPTATAVGLIVRIDVSGAPHNATLGWGYGGASAYYTNYRTDSTPFTYSAPQCARNRFASKGNTFELIRGFDKSDGIVGGEGSGVGIMRVLPEWKARMVGGSSWSTPVGFGSPEAFARSPHDLLQSADFEASQKSDCVTLQKIPLESGKADGFIAVGMGFDMDKVIAQPAEAWKAAIKRNASIARRIVTRTPDPYLDAATTTLAFGNEGIWASQVFVHGGWSWRNGYLGWRTLYGPTVYGWTDRVRTNILNRSRLCVISQGDDAGAISDMLERVGLYYNMNEVFFDMVRHYFEYTNDIELMKEIFPVLEGAIERQNRRLRPAGGVLYESALNTWISDSHWYIDAQCTQASAYMLRTYEFMADVARRIGRDAEPFRLQADKIREAIQSTLWQKRPGVFAECLDTRGNRLLHPEPELPTLYHSAEFGAADDMQVYQMLHWADTHLRQENTPGNGRLYWSSNWHPNHERSYTHSTYEMAFAEELNFAETNFMAGRAETGYAILRACLSGIFNGQVPGGLSCHNYIDGTQRANWEFADSISMWGRTIVEGLFGIRVKRPDNLVILTPSIPDDWPEAAIETPHFSYQLRRSEGQLAIEWKSPVETAVRLRLPIRTATAPRINSNGQELSCRLRKGVGFTWTEADAPKALTGKMQIRYTPLPERAQPVLSPVQNQPLRIELPDLRITEFGDPQGLLTHPRIENGALTGQLNADAGSGVLFVSEDRMEAPSWQPIPLDIQPATPVAKRSWAPLPQPDRPLDKWVLVDMSQSFNTSIPEVLKRVADGATPPPLPTSQVGFSYWREHMVTRCKPACDTAWREKIGTDGIARTTDGIPFKSPKNGPNVAVACLHNKTFRPTVSVPVKAGGRRVYLMIGGVTWPAQSHVVNLRITLRFADGSTEKHDLVQPFDIGNCWGTWCGLCFDTPGNGFENIGGRSGPAGTSAVVDLGRPVPVDTIAHLISYELPGNRQLDRVEMEIIANDVAFGLMGVSVLK